jgi:hypothetical protein
MITSMCVAVSEHVKEHSVWGTASIQKSVKLDNLASAGGNWALLSNHCKLKHSVGHAGKLLLQQRGLHASVSDSLTV